jgi:hypothetical protein
MMTVTEWACRRGRPQVTAEPMLCLGPKPVVLRQSLVSHDTDDRVEDAIRYRIAAPV